ncbi:MAG: hypothetical protein PUB89_06955 [Oscillospiraceae bacterium]|nr:hypothetical protein [Oscillospiraceae bacterium]
MCKAMEDMRNEAAYEASKAKAIQIAKRMLDSGKLTYEEIAEFAGLTLEEVKALDEKKTA